MCVCVCVCVCVSVCVCVCVCEDVMLCGSYDSWLLVILLSIFLGWNVIHKRSKLQRSLSPPSLSISLSLLCTCMCVRLCSETKRSETNMSKLDDILSDVGELVQGAYKLRASYTSSIQVKDWPFYSEPERQMLKR